MTTWYEQEQSASEAEEEIPTRRPGERLNQTIQTIRKGVKDIPQKVARTIRQADDTVKELANPSTPQFQSPKPSRTRW